MRRCCLEYEQWPLIALRARYTGLLKSVTSSSEGKKQKLLLALSDLLLLFHWNNSVLLKAQYKQKVSQTYIHTTVRNELFYAVCFPNIYYVL